MGTGERDGERAGARLELKEGIAVELVGVFLREHSVHRHDTAPLLRILIVCLRAAGLAVDRTRRRRGGGLRGGRTDVHRTQLARHRRHPRLELCCPRRPRHRPSSHRSVTGGLR
jgi:hypothetical protein